MCEEIIGELRIDCPDIPMIVKLKEYLGEDIRQHKYWTKVGSSNFVQFKLNDSMDGIVWDGTEKFHNPAEIIEFLIVNMQEYYDYFSLTGSLTRAGNNPDERIKITVTDNIIDEQVMKLRGQKILCPNCEEHFFIEDSQ